MPILQPGHIRWAAGSPRRLAEARPNGPPPDDFRSWPGARRVP